MEYISKKISEKINLASFNKNRSEELIRSRTFLDFQLVIVFSFLFNKHFSKISQEAKEDILSKIRRPALGTLMNLIRLLDYDKEFKKFTYNIEKYIKLRNDKFGHGFLFDEGSLPDEKIKDINEIINKITSLDFYKTKYAIVHVIDINNESVSGERYFNNEIKGWSAPISVFELRPIIGDCYLMKPFSISSWKSEYFKITPFICIQNQQNFYCFKNIKEPEIFQIAYNNILQNEDERCFEWKNIDPSIWSITSENYNNLIRISFNKTISNQYTNNFKEFFNIGRASLQNDIKEFIKSKSAAILTLWGHGGVGKTALIQFVCYNYFKQEEKIFSYIIFLTAKDRRFDFVSSRIVKETTPIIKTKKDLIERIIEVLPIDNSLSIEEKEKEITIFTSNKPLLLVIDDFETITFDERKKIISFIKGLDVNHYKIIITTRIHDLKVGEQISVNQLDKGQTIELLDEIFKNSFTHNFSTLSNEIKEIEDFERKVFRITDGRPLFIWQLAFILTQGEDLSDISDYHLTDTNNAINFLYGRIIDRLTLDGKLLFKSISAIVSNKDLKFDLDYLKFVLKDDFEHRESNFDSALQSLVDYKIIEKDELSDLIQYKVYAEPILSIMTEQLTNDIERRIDILKKLEDFKDVGIGLSENNLNNAIRFSKINSDDYIAVTDRFFSVISDELNNLDIKFKTLDYGLNYIQLQDEEKDDIFDFLKRVRPYFKDTDLELRFVLVFGRKYKDYGEIDNEIKLYWDSIHSFHISNKLPNKYYYDIASKVILFRIRLEFKEKDRIKNSPLLDEHETRSKNKIVKKNLEEIREFSVKFLQNIESHFSNTQFDNQIQIKVENTIFKIIDLYIRLNRLQESMDLLNNLDLICSLDIRKIADYKDKINLYKKSREKQKGQKYKKFKRNYISEFGELLKKVISK